MRLHHMFRYVRQAKAGQCGTKHLACGVQDELAFDAHPQFAPSFFDSQAYKPPCIGRRKQMQLCSVNG